MPLVPLSSSLAGARKRLTRATSCPNRGIWREASEVEGEFPSCDSGEEMASGVACEVGRIDVMD
jgi:hypothetical protein